MGNRYGIPRYLYTKPLTYGLEQRTQKVDLFPDLSCQNALRLKSRELDAALLSPIDYARNSNEYLMVPNICVSSTGNRTMLLHFRKGLRTINSIAADIGLISELVLAKIILIEKYDTNPQFVPMAPASPASRPDVTAMLAKADAALLVGGPTLSSSRETECAIDLVEEWVDLTDLPYVHAIWLSHRNSLAPSNLYVLRRSCDEGRRHLRDIALVASKEGQGTPEECEAYLASLDFNLDEAAIESLSEFCRYAFYHGILGEVPEIRFYPPELDPGIHSNSVA
jgi:chorismate dehydratase